MSKLTSGLPYEDRLGNEVHADFRGILRMQEIFGDSEFNSTQKWASALYLLYGDAAPPDLNAAIEEIMWFVSGGETESDGESDSKGKKDKKYDFVFDEDYIIGGFQQAYGVDLTDDELTLHWWRFLALFKSLPDNTEMANRIRLRGTDTGKMKGEEKRRMDEAKRAVALPKRGGGMKKPSLNERLAMKQKMLEGSHERE